MFRAHCCYENTFNGQTPRIFLCGKNMRRNLAHTNVHHREINNFPDSLVLTEDFNACASVWLDFTHFPSNRSFWGRYL